MLSLALMVLAQPGGCPYPCDVGATSVPARVSPDGPLALVDTGDASEWRVQDPQGVWLGPTRGRLPPPRRVLSDLNAKPVVDAFGQRFPVREDHRDPTPLAGLSWGMSRTEFEAATGASTASSVPATFAGRSGRATPVFEKDHLSELEFVDDTLTEAQAKVLLTSKFSATLATFRRTRAWRTKTTMATVAGPRITFRSTVW
jgi:hypothetical protein